MFEAKLTKLIPNYFQVLPLHTFEMRGADSRKFLKGSEKARKIQR